ncbi:hypothetical protein [Streptomyces sp. NPDC088135]|uniref:hypothetical protein n=1 Tax=Streptomyces sp. NPDC088135 TaxID=3160993 RepID=UPI0034414B68
MHSLVELLPVMQPVQVPDLAAVRDRAVQHAQQVGDEFTPALGVDSDGFVPRLLVAVDLERDPRRLTVFDIVPLFAVRWPPQVDRNDAVGSACARRSVDVRTQVFGGECRRTSASRATTAASAPQPIFLVRRWPPLGRIAAWPELDEALRPVFTTRPHERPSASQLAQWLRSLPS